MRIKYFNVLLVFLAATTLSFAHNTDPNRLKGRYTKEKKIKKEYNVNSDAMLRISNSYGNVDVTSWNENRVVIEVTVKTNGNNEDKVAEKLDDIDVEFDANGGLVYARTKIGKEKSSWWNSWNDNNNVNMEINYAIKVPVTNSVDLSNDYGGIFLNRIEGQAKISCDYGRLELGELMAENNYLSFDYTNNSTIGYMKSGKINADYSSFTLEKSEYVELNADYTKSTFEDINSLNYACDYGNLTAENLGKITGRGDYLSVRLGQIMGDVNLNADYGSIKIDKLTSEAGDVVIQSDYAGITIGYAQDYNFTFNIKLEYAGLSGDDDFEMIKKRIESSDKYYEGYYGNSSSQNNININSEYGGVTFKKSY